MLFRIWIWAFSDIGSTAPTNLPDYMSMREGMPSSDGFSRLLRKLAKGNLLVDSFSARLWCYFNSGMILKCTRQTESIPCGVRTAEACSISLFPL